MQNAVLGVELMDARMWLRRLRSLFQKARLYHITPSRLASWALSSYSFRTARSCNLGLPRALWIEATNVCNLQCTICPTGSGTLGRTKAYLSYASFKAVVDELSGSLLRVVFSGYGEPLLNPEIYDMLSYAHKRKIFTEVYSNLLLADDDSLRRLIESKVDLLVVAVDIAPNGSNWRYVRSAAEDIARVKDRLAKLADLKQVHGSKVPVVRVSYPVTKDNVSLLGEAERLAREVQADEFLPKTVNAIVAGKSEEEMKHKFVPEGFSRYARARVGTGHCHWPYSAGLIYANGDFAPCCYLARGEHVFGNVLAEGGVRAVWNNAKFQSFRYRLMHEPESVPHCARCVERFDAL